MASVDDVLEQLGFVASLSAAGLLAGSGLSKALTDGTAPDWLGLLKRVADTKKIDFKRVSPPGRGCPEIASAMARELEGGEAELKRAIATEIEAVHRDANPNALEALGSAMDDIDPPFIVTTNYDRLIEFAWAFGVTLLPSDRDAQASGRVPVYHLHGSCSQPDGLVLTAADYARTHRPTDYRGYRLPIFFAESYLIVVGYSLSDSNMLAAVEVARSFDGAHQEESVLANGARVVILRFTEMPKDQVYMDEGTGALVLETSNVLATLEAVGRFAETYRQIYDEIDFDDDLWEQLDAGAFSLPVEVEEAIVRKLHQLHIGTQADFAAYKPWLSFVMKQLTQPRRCTRHPRLFHALCESLDQRAPYLDTERGRRRIGYAWAATDVLHADDSPLKHDPEVRSRVRSYAESRGMTDLVALIDQIGEPP